MADVLSAVEDPEGQAGQKVPRRQVASHWSQLEASLALQERAHVFQLEQQCFHILISVQETG